MAAVVTFDPINLIITEINTGLAVNDLSVLEIYSEWKDWLLADASRLGYPQAFRVVGGDPISDVASLGSTFFLLNGWRIRPAEYSHKLSLIGNLYTDPAGASAVVSTIGAYTINVEMRVSNLSDSTFINSPDIQFSAFNGGVTVDVTSSYSGTDYPTGTPREPVNNLSDALAIANARGFTVFYVVGDVTITGGLDFTDKSFYGSGESQSTFTIDASATVTNCEFREATIQGTLDGGAHINNCRILNLNYVDGFVTQCIIEGTITLGGDAHLLDCWSGVPGVSTPTIDFNGSASALALRNYNGGMALRNKTSAESVSIDLNSGQIVLENTVTAGTIVCRGVGKLTDNSAGATIINELMNTPNIEQAIREAVVDGTITLEQSLRLMNAVLGGKVSGAGTGTETFRDLGDTKNRVTSTVDAEGNRTNVVRDLG